MREVFLPRATKKSYYFIFKNFGLVDLAVLCTGFLIAGLLGSLLPVTWLVRLILGLLSVLITGVLLVRVDGETKGYQFLWDMVKFIFKPKTKLITNLYQVSQLENLVVQFNTKTKRKNYIGGVKLSVSNLHLLNEQEQVAILSDFSELMQSLTAPCKLIKIDESYNFTNNLNFLQTTEYKNEISNEQIKVLRTLESAKDYTTPMIYYCFYATGLEIAQQQLQILINQINFSRLHLELLNQNQLKGVLNTIQQKAELIKSKHSGKVGFVWAINQLPVKINGFWLSEVIQVPELLIVMNVTPVSKKQAIKRLDKALNQTKTNANSYFFKPSENQNWKQFIDSYESVLEAVSNDVDVVRDVSFYFVAGGNSNVVNEVRQALRDLSNLKGWKYHHLWCFQAEALNSLTASQDFLQKKIGQELPTKTLATSFPVSSTGLIDPQGFYLGQSTDGQPLVFDLFFRDDLRVNSNVLVVGESGSGKSYLAKKLICNLSYRNCKVFIFDPEREYKTLALQFDGQWIDAGGNKRSVINPLQITQSSDEVETNADAYLDQLAMLENFFTIISPRLIDDDEVRSCLMKNIRRLYTKFKINPHTNLKQIQNQHWPTFSDLEKALKARVKVIRSEHERYLVQRLISITELLTEGQYAKYWNGYTSIQMDDAVRFTCFDLHTLLNTSNERIINLQMLLLLRLLTQKLISARNQRKKKERLQKVVVIVDEAHLLIDERNLFALDFFYHTMKRIRKYNGALVMITQNIADFTTGSIKVKKKFTGVINNCQYWFIGGLQQNDLNDLSEMYRSSGGLNQNIKNFIATAKRGKFWVKLSKQEAITLQVDQLTQERSTIENSSY